MQLTSDLPGILNLVAFLLDPVFTNALDEIRHAQPDYPLSIQKL